MQKITTALISVSNTQSLKPISELLHQNGVNILATSGTAKFIKSLDIPSVLISEYTNFPEILGGRVKTLHPKIHAGILAAPKYEQELKELQIPQINLVIANLYAFEQASNKSEISTSEIIEKIDIGGPCMIRAAAKNFEHTTCITSPEDYTSLIAELMRNNMQTTLEFRKKLASKAFDLTAYYDSKISNWLNPEPDHKTHVTIPLFKKSNLRYGENSHQTASLLSSGELSSNGIANAQQIQGKDLSFNNLSDSSAALEITSFFGENSVAIIKHASPCGISCFQDPELSHSSALECDKASAYGGIVSINSHINPSTAKAICRHFYEVIIAPSYSPEALAIFSKKPKLRLLSHNQQTQNTTEFKQISGGGLLQDTDRKKITEGDLEIAHQQGEVNLENAIFAMHCSKFIKSNAIAICKNRCMISFGGGQTSRIDSTKIACSKLGPISDKQAQDITLASDAFFPFPDNITIIARHNIKNIITPKGSIRDGEIVESCKKHGINLIFTQTRHFKH